MAGRARADRAARLLDDISEDDLRRLMHEETIVVEFEPDQAKRSLPRLIAQRGRSAHAARAARRDSQRISHLDDRQLAVLDELRTLRAGARGGERRRRASAAQAHRRQARREAVASHEGKGCPPDTMTLVAGTHGVPGTEGVA